MSVFEALMIMLNFGVLITALLDKKK
ncbi:putative holin-like toxin [Pullulanibacillus camelliae]